MFCPEPKPGIGDPPIVEPAGKSTAVPDDVIVAEPNLMLDPLRYKSRNL